MKKALFASLLLLVVSSTLSCHVANATTVRATETGNAVYAGTSDVMSLNGPLMLYNNSERVKISKNTYSYKSEGQSDAFLKFNVTNLNTNDPITLTLYGTAFSSKSDLAVPPIELYVTSKLSNDGTIPTLLSTTPISIDSTLPTTLTNTKGKTICNEYNFTLSNIPSSYITTSKNGKEEFISFEIVQPIQTSGNNSNPVMYGVTLYGKDSTVTSRGINYNVSPELSGTQAAPPTTPPATPEPTSLILGFISLAGLARFNRKKSA